MKIIVFVLSNIVLTLTLFELNLYFNRRCKEPNKMKNLLIFGILPVVVGYSSVASCYFLVRILTLEERAYDLQFGVVFWIVVMLTYLFKRFFKAQEIIIGKNV